MEQMLARRVCARLTCDFWEHLREDTRALSALEIGQFLLGCACLLISGVWYLALFNDDYSTEDTTDWLIHVTGMTATLNQPSKVVVSEKLDF
jgi:hypothetical protein